MKAPIEAPVHEAYADHPHESETGYLGMWVFLSSEVMFFGAMFLSFSIMRSSHAEGFMEAAQHLSLPWGTLNTAVLLLSSWAIACGEAAFERGRARAAWRSWAAAALLGIVFLGIKFYEYFEKVHSHHVPGRAFDGSDFLHPESAELFHWLYFAMTGLHALHLTIGVAWIGFLAWRFRRAREKPLRATTVTCAALYWHFVDLVWIFLFPLLYLLR